MKWKWHATKMKTKWNESKIKKYILKNCLAAFGHHTGVCSPNAILKQQNLFFLIGTLYTVGNGGQIQQVITPSDTATLTTVDGAQQDGSRYTYYPAVQSADGNQGGTDLKIK